jgi:hypothetical protein
MADQFPFSEEVDLTYDIRALAHGLGGDKEEALPKTRSEEKRWSSEVRRRLPIWVADTVAPLIADELQKQSLSAEIRIEADRLYIDYQAIGSGSGYVAPSVMLEFGARSTGEPASMMMNTADKPPACVRCRPGSFATGLSDMAKFPPVPTNAISPNRLVLDKIVQTRRNTSAADAC